jgi:23S rRNA pseudouridine1911/1915/1917 synthase
MQAMAKPKKTDQAQIFHAGEQEAGDTLLAALRGWLPETSWNEARRLVRKRHVQVNGNLCLDEARRLKAKEVVKVHKFPLAPPPTADRVKIIYVDDQIIVVEKPSGVTSVRHAQEQSWPDKRKQFQPTLDEMLPKVLADTLRARGESFTPAPAPPRSPQRHPRSQKHRLPPHAQRGKHRNDPPPARLPLVVPVHRLDRETSGLMVFARTAAAEHNLIAQFKEHSIERAYQAVAIGVVSAERIETWLVRDRGDGLRGSAAQPEGAQLAITHVRPLQRLGPYTLVECRLETGRTHQIRIHLSERGHMLCGEKVYFGPLGGKKASDTSGAPRLALHAARLEFIHPTTGKPMKFQSELPRDLAQFVARLERGSQDQLDGDQLHE